MHGLASPPAGTLWEAVEAEFDGHRVAGEWVRGPRVPVRGDAVVMYMHGSGFVFCSLRTHRGLVARISSACGLPVFSLDYRLGPEHRFPAAHDDALAAYRWLLSRGYAPEQIVVAGDSAGGHLAVSLAGELRRHGLPLPAGLAPLSPFLDPSWKLCFERDKLAPDPFYYPPAAARIVDLYMDGADPTDPRLDLINMDPAGLPPMLIQAGGQENFGAEAEVFADRVKAAGGDCELQIWPGQIHVFQGAFRIVPEGNAAIAHIGRFVRDVLKLAYEPSKSEVAAAQASGRAPHRKHLSSPR
jgi:epsilon-lactone hydrolase